MITEKIKNFIENNKELETPFLVLDLEVVSNQYDKIKSAFTGCDIYYALKANPAKQILTLLNDKQSKFDAASLNEINLCLSQGILPENISWGSTIKKSHEIAKAYEKGVRLFAFDSEEELEKLAKHAPNSKVFCRINVDNSKSHSSLWPLSKKFGCSKELAVQLLKDAKNKGLQAHGVSFHVGSQQIDYKDWDFAIAQSSYVFNTLAKEEIKLEILNIGGGYPAYGYMQESRSKLPDIESYAGAVKDAICKYIKNSDEVKVILEPGRFIVADAGVIKTKVVLFSHKNIEQNDKKWLYLDVGLFGGLAETMGESIKYKLLTDYENSSETVPAYIAGPTCDGADIMYQKANYNLPTLLKEDDDIIIQSAGAYTVTYSSIGFNGFNPLKDYYVE